MSGTLDHTMMRVSDMERADRVVRTHLEYEEKDRYDGDGFTIVYLGPEGMGDDEAMLELTSNEGDDGVEIGDAWGHIAVRVRDLEAAYAELMDGGVDDYRDPESCGGRYAFVKDPDGHEIELVAREDGSRWSLDHTMIRVEDADAALGLLGPEVRLHRSGTLGIGHVRKLLPRTDERARGGDERRVDVQLRRPELHPSDGWGHLCVRLDDLRDGWERLMVREASDYRDPASCDDMYAFTTDQDGHEIELIARDPDAESLFPF